jgi:ABC-type multidrug transport system fused ATPase/permease subunit
VQQAIDRASSGRTVIVVAHRLSTVRDADQIAHIASGRVEDAGGHDELLERCEPYRMLVQRQLASTMKNDELDATPGSEAGLNA